MFEVVNPAQALIALIEASFQCVFGAEGFEGLELTKGGGQARRFKADDPLLAFLASL